MTLKLCIAGATGHVGQELIKSIQADKQFELMACIGKSNAGNKLRDVVGFDCPDLVIKSSVAEAKNSSQFEVLIDYTTPAAVYQTIIDAISSNIHCVIGTSGLNDNEYEQINALAMDKGTGVFAAGNFSITATLMQHFARIAAQHVPHWEIIDYSPDTKVDAPSGTVRELAFKLGQIRKPQAAIKPEDVAGLPETRGAALNGTQVHAVRLPGFYSSAEVIFGLPGERISIRHDSISYSPYVQGTLLAAAKVSGFRGLVRGLDQLLELQ